MRNMNLGFRRAALLSFLGMAVMGTLAVDAQTPITTANGLWNTGVQSDNSTLIPGNSSTPGFNNPADPHYTETYYIDGETVQATPPTTYTSTTFGVVSTTSGQAFVAAPAATSAWPGQSWVPAASPSQWITYSPNMGLLSNETGSVYLTPSTAVTVYQLVLSGIPAGKLVTITGGVAADDNVTIYANGVNLFSNFASNDNGANNDTKYDEFNSILNLKFTSVSGSDDLDFVVYNNGNYATGLDLQLSGSYQAVPEPSTYVLILGSLGLLAFWRARSRARA
jgi:hypothetical protein